MSGRTSTAPGPVKKGYDQAIGRSRGGLTTKIHVIVDALGNPLALSLTGGNAHDITQAEPLAAQVEPKALLGDLDENRRLPVVEIDRDNSPAKICVGPDYIVRMVWDGGADYFYAVANSLVVYLMELTMPSPPSCRRWRRS